MVARATPETVPVDTVAEELALYAPEGVSLTIGGEPFTILPMTIRQSYKFMRLLTRFLTRGAERAALVKDLPPEAQAQALAALALDDEAADDFVALISLILERDVAWVEAHCRGADPMRVLRAFVAQNDLTRYLGEAMAALRALEILPAAPPTGTASPAPSSSSRRRATGKRTS